MPFDRNLFASKLRRYQAQFQIGAADLQRLTGIAGARLTDLEAGNATPTGDEILIFADVFKCDYRFFVSSDRVAPFEETEELFRRHGDALTKQDRWTIQEFLYLCECEAFLLDQLGRKPTSFSYVARDTYFKRDGERAANAFRAVLSLDARSDTTNVFALLRTVGLRVFRRELENSDISGLFVNHPVAGRCVLVNFGEDVYRQRFTALHEACHAFLDADQPFVVSFESKKWDRKDLVELRANTFAAHFLLPDDLVVGLPRVEWTAERVSDFANRLRVNPATLLFRLRDIDAVDARSVSRLRTASKVPKDAKVDPELPASLTDLQRDRKRALLHRGLSAYYVGLCFDALAAGIISQGRLAEMLLVDDVDLREVATLFGRVLQ